MASTFNPVPLRSVWYRRSARILLGSLLIASGSHSLVAMLEAWLTGARPMVATGIVMPVAGLALILGSGRALRVAVWALGVQLLVTVLVTAMAVATLWPVAGTPHPLPHWGPILAGAFHASLVGGALLWIAGYRSHRNLVNPRR